MRPGHLLVALSVLCAAAPARAQDAARHPTDDARFRPQADVVDEAPYDSTIKKVSAREGVDPQLVRALIQAESAYQPDARSPKGAMGLMQLMPGTARQYALANAYDPVANIKAGIKHLKSLLERYPLDLALAAYNAGEAAVERFNGIPPFRETQDYVARVLRLAGRDGNGRGTGQRTSYGVLGSSLSRAAASKSGVVRSGADPWRAARGPWLQAQPVRDSAPRSRRTSLLK